MSLLFALVNIMCSVAQSCPTLCNPMDISPPDSSVLRTSQARILEWVAISFSRVNIMVGVKVEQSQDTNSAYFWSLCLLGGIDTQRDSYPTGIQGTVGTQRRNTGSRLRRSGKALKNS